MAKKKITQNINKDQFFNDEPVVAPEKSKWLSRHTNYQACNLGQIVPIYYEEVLPSEKKKLTLGMISHTTTPVAPIFNALYTEIRTFFVPMRLCADLLNGYSTRKSPWVKVFGEDNASTSADIVVPLANQKLPNISSQAQSNFYSSRTGLAADNVFDSLDLTNMDDEADPNYLNLAAYELIYQRHYRNENYESSTASDLYKLLFNAYNTTSSFTLSNTFTFEMANREKDYFTGAKPFTLKANSPIKVGLVGTANVIAKGDMHDMTDTSTDVLVGFGDNLAQGFHNLGVESLGFNPNYVKADPQVISGSGLAKIKASNLVADLATASGVSIEELRLLIKTQEMLEKDAIFGSLYAEQLNSHFSCCPLDETLQDPAELYRTTITSNMQAIFQTSSTSGEASILGTIGANSTTQTDPFVILPETTFKEHGIVMVCAVHKLQNVYDTRYFKPKFIYKKARFDFYTPELNDLGYQSVTSKEMRSSSSAVAGFNEAFAEYRYVFNKSHGSLNQSFAYWAPAISNEYSAIATLYKEGVGILDKALSVTSSTAPQFYDAWGFEEECTKPMSLHSIPGFDGVI